MDNRELLELVQALAADEAGWRRYVTGDWSARWYERFALERDFEAWLIGWPQDHGIDLHDHGGSAGGFALVEGSLIESYLDRGRPRRPRRVRQRRWNAGESVAFGADHVHDLVNVRSTPALSVHVYSPPLGEMTFYGSRLDRQLARSR
ncbi:MAG: cysteine dioxygenase [Actinobacteria bacterium]|nr:cysteine dioxygenase [Actinomycetota bacterium]